MCDNFSGNRKRLVGIVYKMQKFSIEELKREYLNTSNGSGSSLGGLSSISGFLRDLMEIGVLNYQNGLYNVSSNGENKYI
jgi:hypothetical protein